MKTYCSAFFPILILIIITGCSKEQFGTTPQSSTQEMSGLQSFQSSDCIDPIQDDPAVDILYAVDNSTSTGIQYLSSDIKNAISRTVNSISGNFDYRVVGINLIPDANDSNPNDDYQVLTNSTKDSVGLPIDGRRISSPNFFDFFQNQTNGNGERGLSRIYNFVYANRNGLFRNKANLIIVLVSNGRDIDVEADAGFQNGESTFNSTNYNTRKIDILSLKNAMNLTQLRFFSITAHTHACVSGWNSSLRSYKKMSNDIYLASGATDSPSSMDSYDLCPSGGGFTNVYAGVNQSITPTITQRTYRFWPITFATANENILSFDNIQVIKNNPITGSKITVPNSQWSLFKNTNSTPVNLQILPTVGIPYSGVHFVQFQSGSEVKSPECVIIRSTSKTEYFGYVTLATKPVESTILLRINNVSIPQSSSNGWTFMGGTPITQNIKVVNPNDAASSENPPVIQSGFMLKLNGADNFYKSGDKVHLDYTPAGI